MLFAEERNEEIIKNEVKSNEKISEVVKLVSFLDEKRTQMMSILLSRFPYSVNDIYKILIDFSIDNLELSK